MKINILLPYKEKFDENKASSVSITVKNNLLHTKFLNQIKKVNLGSKQELQNFEIHFEGFYDSEHSDNIDLKIEYFELDFDNINWKETHINYSKEYVKALNDMLDLDLKFVSLNSPSYYNYETDKIEVSINRDDILKFTGKEFSKYIIYLNGNYQFPKPKKISANISNNHKKYAITWFSLAISILLLYLYFRKKNY